MQNVFVTSKNGYFKYSGKLLGKFSFDGTFVKGGFEIGDSKAKGNLFVCLLSKKPFKTTSKKITYGLEETPFTNKDFFEDLWSSFSKVTMKNESFFVKIISCRGGTLGPFDECKNQIDENLNDENQQRRIEETLIEELRKARKDYNGKFEMAYIHMDNLRIPFYGTLNSVFVEHQVKTWRVIKAIPESKVDLKDLDVKVPTLVQIPMKKFKLKQIGKGAEKNPYIALMMNYGFDFEKQAEYIKEMNTYLKKTKGKFCYLYLFPKNPNGKGCGGLLLEDEGVER